MPLSKHMCNLYRLLTFTIAFSNTGLDMKTHMYLQTKPELSQIKFFSRVFG
jgi:hypothetical protein